MTESNHHSEFKRINQLTLGSHAVITQVYGSIPDIQRISMLGLRKGIALSVVHGPGKRGIVIKVGGARLALGHDIASQIAVSPIVIGKKENIG